MFLARGWRRKVASLVGVTAYALLHAPSSTQPAVADGDTRTLTFVNNHTNESGSFTFRVNGRYDQDALDKLNWFLRDWRLNEQTKMDPQLFDVLWEVYQQSGSTQPIDVLSAYRSPQTNAMLRRRSRLVASKSQHMQGKAIDAHFIDVGPAKIRDVAMRMQEGGVGFYPIGSTPWVHIDSGTVRYWPRMSRSALARLFPDGKTVFIPSDGQPMDGYAEAKAMIEARGGDVQTASGSSGGLLSWLFGGARGGGEDDAEDSGGAPILVGGRGGPPVIASGRQGASPPVVAAAAPAAAQPEPPPPPEAPAATTALSDGASAQANETGPSAPDPSGDSAVELAPLPPRKPVEFLAGLDLVAPMPPRRPMELALAPTQGNGARSADDLIAALIERSALPGAIAKGAPGAPKSALALVDPKSSEAGDPTALARAAAMTPPPLPPPRPRFGAEGVTRMGKSTPSPPSKSTRPSAANPFGTLVMDAFNAPAAPPPGKPTMELRGSSP